jgi:hypothetical protein
MTRRSGRPLAGSRRRTARRRAVAVQARGAVVQREVLGEQQAPAREQEPGREADAEVAAKSDRQRGRQQEVPQVERQHLVARRFVAVRRQRERDPLQVRHVRREGDREAIAAEVGREREEAVAARTGRGR